jgi:hypothetical protein
LRITKAGDKYLRKLPRDRDPGQSAMHAPDAQPTWRPECTTRLETCQGRRTRRNKKLTISAMAHKLAVLMHRLWSRGEAYVPYPVLLQVA